MILATQAGKNRHEHIMESLELFGREVLPEFVERDERSARDKAAAARAGHRRRCWRASRPTITRRCPTRDYEFPAIPRAMADRDRADDFHAWLDDYARKAAAGEDVSRRLANPWHDGTE